MYANYGADTKLCATCALWGGPRHTIPQPKPAFVKVETGQPKGKCLGGGFPNCMMTPISGCGKWMKWPVLR